MTAATSRSGTGASALAEPPSGSRLFWPESPADSLTIRGARVIDPVGGLDGPHDVTIEDGVITAVEPAAEAARGLVLAPAFVDPHVHLRVPGREDEETIATGTAAAASGGYCAILAMPNTDPVVDTASVLGALIEQARDEAAIPTGFMAAISKGLRGEELTEMAELARLGAAAFTDDGRPVASAGLMQRALQYSAVTGRILALHEEEPTLSRDGQMHDGPVSAELGLAGWPSVAESVMIERDCTLAAYEQRPLHIMHLSARASVAAVRAAQERGVAVSAEVSPHHLCLTDETVRTLDTNRKMNPPLRSEDDRQALLAALRDGTIGCVATDHAPHARHEKEAPFEEAPFGVTGLETAFPALYTRLVEPGELELGTLLERMSAGPARVFGLPVPRVEVGARANLVLLDLDATRRVTEDGFRSRSTNSWLLGETLRGAVVKTIAGGRVVHAA
jgi:dihydroorotase